MFPYTLVACLLALVGRRAPTAAPIDEPHCRFGCSVAGLGDVDGDGTPDFLIADPEGPGPGRVWLVSGKTSQTIYTCTGHAAGDDFGWGLRAVGDVDGDGIADWIAGADGPWRFKDGGESYASVRSGRDGRSLYLIRSDDPDQELGRCFAGAGDVDEDGREDVVIGARRTGVAGADGLAYIYSGRDGRRIRVLGSKFEEGTEAFDIACLGDCDGDDVPDTLIALHSPSNGAMAIDSAVLFSGATGEPRWIFRPGTDRYIRRVRPAGDVDGDGVPDVVVACRAAILVLSGRTGRVIRRFEPQASEESETLTREQLLEGDEFGNSLAVLRGPGQLRTLAVGADEADASVGAVELFDLRTGDRTSHLPNKMDFDLYHLGFALDVAGDLDGDGWDDLISGTFSAWGGGDGLALLYSGRDGGEIRRLGRQGDEVIVVGKNGERPRAKLLRSAEPIGRADSSSSIHPTFGSLISEIGDVDGDGAPDLLVADSSWPNGHVWLVSLKKRQALYSVPGLSWPRGDEQLRALGDVDGDGRPDWVQANSCTLRVFSGADGRVLHEFGSTDSLPGQADDSTVSGIGDLDHDGHADILIGTNRIGDGRRESGLACVRSGLDGHVLLVVGREEPRGWLELAVAAAGDVDFDGTPDIAVACGEDPEPKISLIVFSGRTGEVLRRVRDLPTNGAFRLKPCGDLDGDGRPDCIVDSRGLVEVLSDYTNAKHLSLTAAEIERSLGQNMGNAFGGGVACLRDRSAIGHVPMLVVSDPDTTLWGGTIYFCSADDGVVHEVFSERDANAGRERWILSPRDELPPSAEVHHLGSVLANLGDVDGDGFDDVACATENWNGGEDGQVFVLDGLRGKVLYELRREGDNVRVLAIRQD